MANDPYYGHVLQIFQLMRNKQYKISCGSWVDPLCTVLYAQNASLLTLVVTECVRAFPTLSNSALPARWLCACVHAKSLLSRPTLWPMDWVAHQAPLSMDSPGEDTGVGCRALLQGVFPTQGSNVCILCLPALAGWFFATSATWEACVASSIQFSFHSAWR